MNDFQGKCSCESVGWECSLPVKTVLKCHCNACRKLQGSDYSTWVVVPKAQFRLVGDQSLLKKYQATENSAKYFCSKCGSSVYMINGKHFLDGVVLPLGAVILYIPELLPQIQVYTADKAPWVNLHDDTAVFS